MIKEIKVQTTHWICCDHGIITTKQTQLIIIKIKKFNVEATNLIQLYFGLIFYSNKILLNLAINN